MTTGSTKETASANTPSLSGQVAIVTGAGTGLGRAYALQLASQGASVVVNNRATNGPSADRVVAAIRARGGEAVANYECVEAPDAGRRLVAAATEHYGRLDIIIANAAVDRAARFQNVGPEAFDAVMQVNFFSVVRLLHAAWPLLLAAKYGRVLVSTSTAGLYGNHGQAAYASSKAALLGLMKTLAIEGASSGVTVNAIAPYAVTRLTERWFPEQHRSAFTPEALARLAGWLVSDKCCLSGMTVVAGAGHARLARPLETATLSLGADPETAIERLLGMPCEAAPETASGQFEAFMQSL
jgi:NAD(P)-dependent dehydrogenase (short-subunit alcohol dehydrogenase family)